jgi:hypothetical protein
MLRIPIYILLFASLLAAQSLFLPFNEIEHQSVHRLGICYPEARIRLSEAPYSDSTVMQLLPLIRQGDISPFLMYRLNALKPFIRFHRQQAGAYLHLRARAHWLNGFADRESLRLEPDLMFGIRIDESLSAYFDFQVDTDGHEDADYHGVREWKDITGDFRSGAVLYQKPHWSLLAGRLPVHWGPGHTGSLLTSGFAPALDMIKIDLQGGLFRFQAFNAMLVRNGSKRNPSESEADVNRYFSGHRFSLRNDRFELGLHETVIYGGVHEPANPAYLNPLIPYYFSDVMQIERRGDNISVAIDGAWFRPRGFRWYAQVAVDEYYYEGEDYPRRAAFLAGADWCGISRGLPLFLNLEYARMDRWIYNYDAHYAWSRLDYFNSLLGHPLGPDTEMLRSLVEWTPLSVLNTRFQLTWTRRGETTVSTPFNNRDLAGTTRAPFPYGVVTTVLQFQTVVTWRFLPAWRIEMALDALKIHNAQHVRGTDETDTHVRVTVFWDGVMVW